jgi:acetolactate synthase-1/3 small subunit
VVIAIPGNSWKVDAFIRLISGYEILELARTGVAGLGRGTKNIIYINDLRLGAGISDGPDKE